MSELNGNNGAGTVRAARSRIAFGNLDKRHSTRDRATTVALSLRKGEAEALNRRCVELALVGDPTAMRLSMQRLLLKGRAVRLDLPVRHW